MTDPEQRLREALEARAASVTYRGLRPPLPPSGGGPFTRALHRGVKVAGLLALAAALAAVVLTLSDAPEHSPAQVPAPSRTLPPDRPSATPTTSAPTPSPDVPRPERPEQDAG
ncbi:hypothetical protein ACFY93_13065 [Streptomyces sp. NPDC008313]|uniref:hypothetical protein n=1 Tax=Streptomyces sp. NPDC008313 TaxID=3364826 RepID=UPI0036E32256